MNQDEIATQYDQIGKDYLDAQTRFFDGKEDPSRVFIKRNLPSNLEGKKLLELGCGAGWDLKLYQEMGADVSGVDSSHFMINEALRIIDPKKLRIAKNENFGFFYDYDEFDFIIGRFTLLKFFWFESNLCACK